MMFERIEEQMAAKGLSKQRLAEITGIEYLLLLKKFKGGSFFTLNDAIKIKNALNTDDSIETLFG